MAVNGYFKVDDLHADNVGGYAIDPSWWSRIYEYPWALQYAVKNGTMADMGCGHWPRPLKDALADIGMVYAVDLHEKVFELSDRPTLKHIQADFTETIDCLFNVDVVFCISVLEDLGESIPAALCTFAEVLKPGGKLIVTFDVPYDDSKPTPIYPGVTLFDFDRCVERSSFDYVGDFDDGKNGAVVNHEFNLCVYHAVLELI